VLTADRGALARHRSGNFSVGRFLEFLIVLGQDVEMTVRLTQNVRGRGFSREKTIVPAQTPVRLGPYG